MSYIDPTTKQAPLTCFWFNSRVITHAITFFSLKINNSQGVQLKFQVHRDEVHALSYISTFRLKYLGVPKELKTFSLKILQP